MDCSSSSYDSGEEKRRKIDKENKKYNYRKQNFNSDWLENEKFKGWLQEDDDKQKAKCSACNCILVCGKSELLRHRDGKKHKKNMEKIKNAPQIQNFLKRKQSPISNDNQNFEIRLSMFFAEHNVAIQIIDHLLPLLQDIVPDSAIIKGAKLKRTKCTGIIKTVLAGTDRENTIEILKQTKFSIMIDESTDIGVDKHMCVLVRFVHPNSGKVITELLDLIHIGSDCSAASLYASFKSLITKFGMDL